MAATVLAKSARELRTRLRQLIRFLHPRLSMREADEIASSIISSLPRVKWDLIEMEVERCGPGVRVKAIRLYKLVYEDVRMT